MHYIPEGNHLNQVYQRGRRKQPTGEASSVTPGVGVRLQVHKYFMKYCGWVWDR